MRFDVVVLNGGSSSGKSTISRLLQSALEDFWLVLSIDDLIAAIGPQDPDGGAISFGSDGGVTVREPFRAAEFAWYSGIAAMARTGVGVIMEDVFLDGSFSQGRIRAALSGLNLLWVGVRCEGAVARIREEARGDRIAGMAASQAVRVHQGIQYDLEVDTTTATPDQCARAIAAHLSGSASPPREGTG
jgi:chloramphenicol 3-O phosphotransferase